MGDIKDGKGSSDATARGFTSPYWLTLHQIKVFPGVKLKPKAGKPVTIQRTFEGARGSRTYNVTFYNADQTTNPKAVAITDNPWGFDQIILVPQRSTQGAALDGFALADTRTPECGGGVFASKKALEDHVKTLLREIGVTDSIKTTNPPQYDFLPELLRRHPKYPGKLVGMTDLAIRRNRVTPSPKHFILNLVKKGHSWKSFRGLNVERKITTRARCDRPYLNGVRNT